MILIETVSLKSSERSAQTDLGLCAHVLGWLSLPDCICYR